MLRSLRSLRPLPDSFLFGVGISDHQSEAYIPEFEDIADVWERASNKTRRGKATDFWYRYAEDIANAKALGCKAFRFSISWARVEPTPGNYSEAAFEHYKQIIAAIKAAGMEPFVTLVHFTWPRHVEERGGLISNDFPQLFANYAAEVAKRFGVEVTYWVPFNEPNQMGMGYMNFWSGGSYALPPGLSEGITAGEQIQMVQKLIRNLFLAHSAARTEIKKINPNAMVGANPAGLGLPSWLQRLLDRNIIRMRSESDFVRQGRRFTRRPLLAHGKVDVVLATLTRAPEREEEVDFSEIYFVAGQTLLVKADSIATGAQDFAGKFIAVISTSTAEQNLQRLIPGAHPRVVGTYSAALHDLDRGQVEAILADNTILQGLMNQHPHHYKLIGGLLTHEPYAAALTRGSRELLDVVNIAIEQFKSSGAWAEAYQRYFPGQPIPPRPTEGLQAMADVRGRSSVQDAQERLGIVNRKLPLAKPRTLLRRIQDRGHLIVAVKDNVPGFSTRDLETGVYSGLEIDLAREIAHVIFGDRVKVRFVAAETQERLPLLRSLFSFLDPLLKLYSIFTTWVNANWWHLGMNGKLPEFFCPRECIGQQDFIGFDYYWGLSSLRFYRLQRLVQSFVLGQGLSNAPVWPKGIYNAIKFHAELFPGQPIIICENGSVVSADSIERAVYLRRHIREVQRAVNDGYNVVGYFVWSITSNREWGAKFGDDNDFGLFHINLDGDEQLTRVLTPSAEAYREIIVKRGV